MGKGLTVALGGAAGGALNACLCYAEIPVPVGAHSEFHWHVIPAGAVHGGVIAWIATAGAALTLRQHLGVRLLWGVPLAWVAGYLSWVPLNRSAFNDPWGKSVTWPFHETWVVALLAPFMYFGLVSLCLYLSLALPRIDGAKLATHILRASLAGVLGSLWWWISWEPWYFSLLHGLIWGTCVGLGTWATFRRTAPGAQ